MDHFDRLYRRRVSKKLITPGDNEPSGLILTTILGIVGAFVATYLGQALGWYSAGEHAGLIGATVGAIVVIFRFGAPLLEGRGGPFPNRQRGTPTVRDCPPRNLGRRSVTTPFRCDKAQLIGWNVPEARTLVKSSGESAPFRVSLAWPPFMQKGVG